MDPYSIRKMRMAEAMVIAPGAAVYVEVQKSGRHGLVKDSNALGNIYNLSDTDSDGDVRV